MLQCFLGFCVLLKLEVLWSNSWRNVEISSNMGVVYPQMANFCGIKMLTLGQTFFRIITVNNFNNKWGKDQTYWRREYVQNVLDFHFRFCTVTSFVEVFWPGRFSCYYLWEICGMLGKFHGRNNASVPIIPIFLIQSLSKSK